MKRLFALTFALTLMALCLFATNLVYGGVETATVWQDATSTSLRFEVSVAAGLLEGQPSGRLFVTAGFNSQPEPRTQIGNTGLGSPPVFGKDVSDFGAGKTVAIDDKAAAFPIDSLAKLTAGEYYVQALFDANRDLKSVNAPGNLYSEVVKVTLDPAKGGVVKLVLTHKVADEQLPAETEFVKFVKLKSELLSKFHDRPIYLRAGVILPSSYNREPQRKYPLRVHIGGYGARYTGVLNMMRIGPGFYTTWAATGGPQMLVLHLDGDGPYGDPYQVNSENNGPYGDAITQELIPYVEKTYRGIGEPQARFTDGGSTGGWVSLALQVFYPDFFNGCWSYCPDGVDFRAFQIINIYQDKNAYVNRHGFERPSARDRNGDTRFTIRHECQMENVIGLGDSWTMSGQQWGAWNATYGPRGADGRPKPLWDAKTGAIDRSVTDHWKKYDLRLILQENWKILGPKLRGKMRIWVGDADDYFLNNAVRLLDDFLSTANPSAEAWVAYGRGQGHCWFGITEQQMMKDMIAASMR